VVDNTLTTLSEGKHEKPRRRFDCSAF
jgi:hypothetical protein